MKQAEVSRATIGRIPTYLKYLKSIRHRETISATALAHALGLGEVQVRKDLSAVSGAGRPRVGYHTRQLIRAFESFLSGDDSLVVIAGAGKLGRALLDYGGFDEYGLHVAAAFDIAVQTAEQSNTGKPVFPMRELADFCRTHAVRIGVIAVPAEAAQSVCDQFLTCGIQAIWCFAPCMLRVPEGFPVQYENMALSLAHLNKKIQCAETPEQNAQPD